LQVNLRFISKKVQNKDGNWNETQVHDVLKEILKQLCNILYSPHATQILHLAFSIGC